MKPHQQLKGKAQFWRPIDHSVCDLSVQKPANIKSPQSISPTPKLPVAPLLITAGKASGKKLIFLVGVDMSWVKASTQSCLLQQNIHKNKQNVGKP